MNTFTELITWHEQLGPVPASPPSDQRTVLAVLDRQPERCYRAFYADGHWIDAGHGGVIPAGQVRAWAELPNGRRGAGESAEQCGQLAVLQGLLRECDAVLSTLEGESQEEAQQLEKLRAQILAALHPEALDGGPQAGLFGLRGGLYAAAGLGGREGSAS